MPKLRTFAAMSGHERMAVAEAFAALTYAKLLVRFIPPKAWRKRFGAVGAWDDTAQQQGANEDTLKLVSQAIQRARRNAPIPYICLPQALAARWMLERRGIASDLFIGVAKAPTANDRFHAWLKVGDRFITGTCDEGDYALFYA